MKCAAVTLPVLSHRASGKPDAVAELAILIVCSVFSAVCLMAVFVTFRARMLFVFMRTLLTDVTLFGSSPIKIKGSHTFMVAEHLLFNAQDPSVAMSVEQAIHELQEQLQRASAGLQAMHQELTALRSVVDTRWRVRLVEPKTLMPDRFGKKNELENLVVSGERLRWRGARSAEAGDEDR